MRICDAEIPESTGGTSSDKRRGGIDARPRRRPPPKRIVPSGLEALARLLGRAAAAEASARLAMTITPDTDQPPK
jgi:hypothetical protein